VNLVFNCIYVSINNSWLRDYFNLIFVPELELRDSTNTASSALYLELHPEKNDSEGRLRTKLFD